eukprot:TRINITY_DN765_c3_g1_i11.p3 TRINITY_DN765_c3_g1~~TRINITY_DN765_c3_g1_i11.p3  ORF type:complete len:112 (+),score=4.31 TRINITY_DN765_c3_g1_i11:728-1063(+)
MTACGAECTPAPHLSCQYISAPQFPKALNAIYTTRFEIDRPRGCRTSAPRLCQVITAYGADALRLYLIDSPVVRAEPLRFREPGVQAVVKDVLLPWFNTLRFFVQQVCDFL